jgi:hypothetical protein
MKTYSKANFLKEKLSCCMKNSMLAILSKSEGKAFIGDLKSKIPNEKRKSSPVVGCGTPVVKL